MGKKEKYYVVWNGPEPGVYASWDECRRRVEGVPGAVFKSFGSEAEAQEAYYGTPADHIGRTPRAAAPPAATAAAPQDAAAAAVAMPPAPPRLPAGVTAESIAVDAACSGNPGQMEYRGVYLRTGQVIFHFGPVYGTNNIGEFLAIVHALALQRQKGIALPVYTDSRNALLWVRARRCRTKLPRTPRTEELFRLIGRAEKWLRDNDHADIPLLKWETKQWGEIPADFGRK